MSSYLIYHPTRQKSVFDNMTVYHAPNQHHQDPYVWNSQFLHTYCHMPQMIPQEGYINFWISGDSFPDFSYLYCDLVFVIQNKVYWEDRNHIALGDERVDTYESYIDHYQWAGEQHYFKRRRRFTLKADPKRSFQPQDVHGKLIDILPFLTSDMGLSLGYLRAGLRANIGSKPLKLDGNVANALYEWLQSNVSVRLTGDILKSIRRQHPELASPVFGNSNSKIPLVNGRDSTRKKCGS